MFDKEKQDNVKVKNLMHMLPSIISPSEGMQEVMDKFERSGAWNLPVVEEGRYMGFVSKSRIFNVYRKKMIRQNQD
jgi:CIC family chloride channel protein